MNDPTTGFLLLRVKKTSFAGRVILEPIQLP
jgi:hypothetical protein